MTVFMRDTDAFTWYMERDPTLRSTVVAVAWLDSSPDWDVLVAKLDRATRLIPMFRQRVAEPPARLATPRWTFDDGFDLTWHLRRMDSPAPHTPATVISVARVAAMTGFDRCRPLWEFTLIEHLVGDRAALVMKLHHSLTDGVGGMDLALLLFDLDPAAPTRPMPLAPRGETLGTLDLARGGLADDWRRATGFARRRITGAIPSLRQAARDPVGTVREAVETTMSIGRTVAPVTNTLSPIMRARGLGRQLDLVTVRLPDLKAAAVAGHGTLNDAFMAAVAGGFRRYHERHGAEVASLRVTLPISLRTAQDPVGGNRITLIRFAVPVAETDPAARIRAMGRLCRAAREERSLPHTNAIAGTLNVLPRAAVASMLKHVDFVASNVPGFTQPVYLAGAKVQWYVPFGPTTGSAVNVTLLSYNGTCFVGVNTDSAAVPDPDVLAACLRDGFDEVLRLAGPHRRALLPLHDAPSTPRRARTRSRPAVEPAWSA